MFVFHKVLGLEGKLESRPTVTRLSMFVRYSSIHRHVSTTALFLILGLFRARNCHLPVTIDCDKKKSAVLDSGASVDITSESHRRGQLIDSPEMVQGISGTTHAWLTRVHGTLKHSVAFRTCCKQKRGSKTSNNFTCQTRPTKSCLSHNLSKQVTFHISGHHHRKAGSLPRARNGSPWF